MTKSELQKTFIITFEKAFTEHIPGNRMYSIVTDMFMVSHQVKVFSSYNHFRAIRSNMYKSGELVPSDRPNYCNVSTHRLRCPSCRKRINLQMIPVIAPQ